MCDVPFSNNLKVAQNIVIRSKVDWRWNLQLLEALKGHLMMNANKTWNLKKPESTTKDELQQNLQL